MRSRYSAKCRRCATSFASGTLIYWSKASGALCLACGEKETPKADSPATAGENTFDVRSITNIPKDSEWSIDWSELKEFTKAAYAAEKLPKGFNSENTRRLEEHLMNPSVGFQGYTRSQVNSWLMDGYHTDAIQGLADFIPPIREKRKLKFTDEGDEFNYDLAASGDENYMSQWSKRETIPGIRIDVVFSMAGSVDPAVVNAFNRWVCRVIYSIEAGGIDAEINYVNDSNWNAAPSGPKYTVIRVKKENEQTDFTSLSPMLSPACYRSFLFAAIVMHGESLGRRVNSGIARPQNRMRWEVKFDEEKRRIAFVTPRNPYAFDEDSMTLQLREALKLLKG